MYFNHNMSLIVTGIPITTCHCVMYISITTCHCHVCFNHNMSLSDTFISFITICHRKLKWVFIHQKIITTLDTNIKSFKLIISHYNVFTIHNNVTTVDINMELFNWLFHWKMYSLFTITLQQSILILHHSQHYFTK